MTKEMADLVEAINLAKKLINAIPGADDSEFVDGYNKAMNEVLEYIADLKE